MPEIEIGLALVFETPPSVGAAGASDTLADKAVTRNGRDEFIIPASQVKGKLRHSCQQLLSANGVEVCRPPRPQDMCPRAGVNGPCLLCQIFGSPFDRSRLRFHDLVATQAYLPGDTSRAMVSLNRSRRTAEAKRLFLVETAPNVKGLRFENEHAVTGHVGDERHAHLLLAGLKLLFSWGGGAGRGLGWGEVAGLQGGEVYALVDGRETTINVEEVKALCAS
ncbi:MAG: RAMP superfamily CRISPR-associated protein [Acidobacteriota bacterium]|nr:RAMP superfamily CRISPR-associated protein [Acidobacteriota bacterium]